MAARSPRSVHAFGRERRLERRSFLRIAVGTAGLAAASSLLAACGNAAPQPAAPTSAPAAAPKPADAAKPAAPAAAAGATPAPAAPAAAGAATSAPAAAAQT